MKAPIAFIAEARLSAGGTIAARRRDTHGLPGRGQHPPDEMPATGPLRGLD